MLKNFVRIKFKSHDGRTRWYWARKLRPGLYKRVTEEGDECIREKVRKDGCSVCTEELLAGEPLEERPARMNNHYGLLEEVE